MERALAGSELQRLVVLIVRVAPNHSRRPAGRHVMERALKDEAERLQPTQNAADAGPGEEDREMEDEACDQAGADLAAGSPPGRS